ncbi:MAG: CDP-glycerol glycerophosphotransferase family protein, partial [Deltaproteobacteria bacterium]|nr:CDP-glycerol glycerophosphotransferase family protein [Deltaproteobacteria bacterium]
MNLELLAIEYSSRMAKRWYLHPDFASIGLYEGVHLGECSEYTVFRELMRIVKFKLLTCRPGGPGALPPESMEGPSLRKARQSRLLSFEQLAASARITDQDSPRPAILLSVRAQNLALARALDSSGVFDLVVEGNREAISRPLIRNGIDYERFEDFLTPEIRLACEARFAALMPLWMEAVEGKSFQAQFSLGETSLFPEIGDSLRNLFQGEFLQEALYIETLKHLVRQRRLVMVLVWNDSLPLHRALVLFAQEAGVPVLHVAHAIYGMEPTNEVVYADRIAVYGDHSKELYVGRGNPPEKVVVTGNPDWDKYKYLHTVLSRAEVCRSLGLDRRKRIVLFATFFVAGPMAAADSSLPKRFFQTLLRSIKRLGSRYQMQLAVKLHPAERDRGSWYRRIAAQEDMGDVVVEAGHLEELLFVSDLLICRGSNIGFEALLLGKPVISYGLPVRGEEEAVTIVKDSSELTRAIEKSLFDYTYREALEKKREKAIYRFNYLWDGRATHRVLGLIEEMTGID